MVRCARRQARNHFPLSYRFAASRTHFRRSCPIRNRKPVFVVNSCFQTVRIHGAIQSTFSFAHACRRASVHSRLTCSRKPLVGSFTTSMTVSRDDPEMIHSTRSQTRDGFALF